jgi:hypothetical protein
MHTKASEISKLRRVVGHRAHEPICGGLPHSVKEAKENIHHDSAAVAMISWVHLPRTWRERMSIILPTKMKVVILAQKISQSLQN